MRLLRYARVVFLCFLAAAIAGCSTLMECGKGLVGISTKTLEDNRQSAITKQCEGNYQSCYNKTKEALVAKVAYIYAEDTRKHLLAIYVSQEDTTPVGLFFSEVDPTHTRIEVSSPSSYAKELIALMISPVLATTPLKSGKD